MAITLPPAFSLASKALPPDSASQQPTLQSAPVVVEDVEQTGPQRKVRSQVVMSASGEGWTVFDTASQTSLSSQSFPPSVRFSAPACGLITNHYRASDSGPSTTARVRFVYSPIASHPTHASLAVRQGRSVCVHAEIEGKGGFGEALSGGQDDGRLYYGEFEAAVIGLCVLEGSAARPTTVAVLLKTGEVVVCSPDLREVLQRRKPPADWARIYVQGCLLRLRHLHTKGANSQDLLIQLLRPASPPKIESTPVPTAGKKRKDRVGDEVKRGHSPHGWLCDLVFHRRLGGSQPDEDETDEEGPSVLNVGGSLVDVAVISKARLVVLRSDGLLETWRLHLRPPQRQPRLTRLGDGLRLDPAQLPPLESRTCALCRVSTLPELVVLMVCTTKPQQTPSILVLALDLKFRKVVSTSTIGLPASFQADSAGEASAFIAARDVPHYPDVVLSIEGGGRQSLQIQNVMASAVYSNAAACVTDPQIARLTDQWLHWPSLGLQQQVEEAIEVIHRGELGDQCSGLGHVVLQVMNLWKAHQKGWTQSSAKKADHHWGEWTESRALALSKAKIQAKMTGWLPWYAIPGAPKVTTVLTVKVLRALVRVCLSPWQDHRLVCDIDHSAHPTKIVHWLLHEKVLTDSMIGEGGILATFMRAGEWSYILEAVSLLPDLTDTAIGQVMQRALEEPQRPHLGRVLARVVSKDPPYASTSRAGVVASLSAEQAAAVLELLSVWMFAYASQPDPEVEIRVDRPKSNAGGQQTNELLQVPSAAQLISFAQAVLDAHSIALLQYAPAHPILKSLATTTTQWVKQEQEFLRLESSLGAFARKMRQDDAARLARTRMNQRLQREGVVDTSVEVKKGFTIVDGMLVNKEKQAQREAHRHVGTYAMEKLEL